MAGIHPGLVSTVIPVHNRPGFVVGAVASVLAQTYRPIEIILVDDGSTDGQGRVCEDLAERNPETIRTIRQECGGPGAAREAGRRQAQGEFLQYLDSDDLLETEKFELQVNALRGDPSADVAYCRTALLYDEGGMPREDPDEPRHAVESIFPSALRGRLWSTAAPLWRRTLADRMGPWTTLRIEEDLEYEARAGSMGAKLAYVPRALAIHRHHQGERASGNTLRNPTRMRWRYESHALVYGHARHAGVTHADPEMQRYARELFLLARQCGAAGLREESRHLFELAREASGPIRGRGLEFRLYDFGARLLGWPGAGRLSTTMDSLKPATARERREEDRPR